MTYTPDEIALSIINEGVAGRTDGNAEVLHDVITPRGIQIALATAIVETNDQDLANPDDPASEAIPNDGDGEDHASEGVFQQQPWWGTLLERMTPDLAAAQFYNRLQGLDYNDPNTSPGTFAQDVQGSAYPDRYDEHFQEAVEQYDRLTGAPAPAPDSATSYTVKPGDTLSGIDQEFGVSEDAVLAANPSITDPNTIYAGEVIAIPAKRDKYGGRRAVQVVGGKA